MKSVGKFLSFLLGIAAACAFCAHDLSTAVASSPYEGDSTYYATDGLRGQNTAGGGYGVHGMSGVAGASGAGVKGEDGSGGWGVWAVTSGGSGSGIAVYGSASGANAIGVKAESATGDGLLAVTTSSAYSAVEAHNFGSGPGIYALSTSGVGMSVQGGANNYGTTTYGASNTYAAAYVSQTGTAPAVFAHGQNGNGVAIVADGILEADYKIRFGNQSTSTVIVTGGVSPNGFMNGNPGDLYLCSAGSLWVKQSGNNTNTGWVQK